MGNYRHPQIRALYFLLFFTLYNYLTRSRNHLCRKALYGWSRIWHQRADFTFSGGRSLAATLRHHHRCVSALTWEDHPWESGVGSGSTALSQLTLLLILLPAPPAGTAIPAWASFHRELDRAQELRSCRSLDRRNYQTGLDSNDWPGAKGAGSCNWCHKKVTSLFKKVPRSWNQMVVCMFVTDFTD